LASAPQGIHNVLVHKKLLDVTHIFDNEYGPYAQLHVSERRRRHRRVRGARLTAPTNPQYMWGLQRDAWGNVIDKAGRKYAVVHQINRSPPLMKQYEGEYPMVPLEWRSKKIDLKG
jgi:hypothetical protein